MSLEENKAIVRKLFEVINKQSLDSLDELVAQDYVDHPCLENGSSFVGIIFD